MLVVVTFFFIGYSEFWREKRKEIGVITMEKQYEEKRKKMKEIVELLNRASKAYYQDAKEIMSNYEYDKLYDDLVALEKETGIILANSPTQNVGYEVLSELPKEAHASRMLSLDKTKEIADLESWIGEKEGVLSWKLDGLTIVLSYEGGSLKKAVTRGNGEIGEVITNNAKVFKNLPLEIPFKGDLVLRGEAVISYSDFEKINEQIKDTNTKYKNPRNLCSGSVRQLNNQITAERNVKFYAFSLVSYQGEDLPDFENSRKKQLLWLEKQGFDVVERKIVTRETMEKGVQWFSKQITENDIPSDGLVLLYDDIAYGKSLGTTAKYPRDSIAFKWQDEIAETKLLEVEWSASRTGLINPIAVFSPVELEGTTVSRASLHNISIMEKLELGLGDEITVYKANMIIPQIAENKTRSGMVPCPEKCPVCSANTCVKQENEVKVLVCNNPDCQAKQVKTFVHFMSRDAMNVEGLSEATIEKLIGKGIVKELADLFSLQNYKDVIVEMEGFGNKSFENMVASIERARTVSMPQFIYSLGISNIGLSNAKLICKAYENDLDRMINAKIEELIEIDGIGQVIAETFCAYMSKEKNIKIINNLRKEMQFKNVEVNEEEQSMVGLQFVITGSVEKFSNRKELKAYIEDRGGKVTGTVSSKTNYLINNDSQSNSSKNKKAKELGVSVLTEEQFLELFG